MSIIGFRESMLRPFDLPKLQPGFSTPEAIARQMRRAQSLGLAGPTPQEAYERDRANQLADQQHQEQLRLGDLASQQSFQAGEAEKSRAAAEAENEAGRQFTAEGQMWRQQEDERVQRDLAARAQWEQEQRNAESIAAQNLRAQQANAARVKAAQLRATDQINRQGEKRKGIETLEEAYEVLQSQPQATLGRLWQGAKEATGLAPPPRITPEKATATILSRGRSLPKGPPRLPKTPEQIEREAAARARGAASGRPPQVSSGEQDLTGRRNRDFNEALMSVESTMPAPASATPAARDKLRGMNKMQIAREAQNYRANGLTAEADWLDAIAKNMQY